MFQCVAGSVRFLYNRTVQHRLHVFTEFGKVFTAQFRLLPGFLFCQALRFFLSREFIDPLNLFSVHLASSGLWFQHIYGGLTVIQGKWFVPGADLSVLLPVREAVFGRGTDELDPVSWNVLVYDNSVPAATGRIWWADGAFWLGDLAVLEDYRGRKLGDLVLRLLLYKAQNHAAREVRLRCPDSLTGFFGRLGLRELPSDDRDAVEMVIPGSMIDLDTCKNCPKASCPNRQ